MNHSSATVHPVVFTDQLKNKTAHLHNQLDSSPLAQVIVAEQVQVKDYIHYLEVMYKVHECVEKHVFPLLESIVPDLAERKRARKAELDLEALGVHAFESRVQPLFENDPRKISIPQALGILYVIEGSTLGGRYILKNISRLHNNHTFTGYLQAYGEHTGSKWKTLLGLVNRYEAEKNCGEAMLEGAGMVYKKLVDLFISAPQKT